jgi:hypothetical protein
VALALLGAGAASAAPIAQATSVITDDLGAFSVEKSVRVYNDASGDDPFPADGKYTYVYKLVALAGDPICGFKVLVASTSVSTAGYIDTGGINPEVVTIGATQTTYELADPDNPFNCIYTGGTTFTSDLYLTSPLGPGTTGDVVTVSLNSFSGFDESGECLGPVEEPEIGDPMPCTIGFWKNRTLEKNGTLQWFPDPQIGQVVTAAVALSGGLFANEADLLANLQSKGPRSIQDRGKQQLAATYMNLAAGDLFPDNGKCQLFEENVISTNACGTNVTVGASVTEARSDIDGDSAAQHSAQECSDDINNGIGLIE